MLKIGVLREIKPSEGRVMLTPEGVRHLTQCGIEVLVEDNAGKNCGFSNDSYEQAGAVILPTMEKIYQKAALILHVQPPQPVEFELLDDSHISVSFLNLLHHPERLRTLLDTRASFISAELIQDENGQYPLLMAVSEIAGRMAIHQAAQLLTITAGGKGKLLAGLDDVKPAVVTIIGAGMAGRTAAAAASLNGASVNLVRLKSRDLGYLSNKYQQLRVYDFSEQILRELLPQTDVLIVVVYSLKDKIDIFISKEMIATMEKGSVVMDLSVEQAAIVESSHITNHEQPTFLNNGIVYYCVPNISAIVPVTASRIISERILPYLKTLAGKGIKQALDAEPALVAALSVYKGKITNRYYAQYFHEEFYNIFELLELNL